MSTEAFQTYHLREVAGVFHDPEAVERAVDKLTERGFADGDFAIMATDEVVKEKLSDRLRPVEKMADDAKAPRHAFLPRSDRKMAEAAVIGAPMFLLGVAGALSVVATGGAAAMALVAAAAGGAFGAGIGAGLATVIEQSHADRLAKLMQAGGIVLWVRTPDKDAEKTAIDILKAEGGEAVHAHEIERTWGPEDIPFSEANPDPFLERDPV